MNRLTSLDESLKVLSIFKEPRGFIAMMNWLLGVKMRACDVSHPHETVSTFSLRATKRRSRRARSVNWDVKGRPCSSKELDIVKAELVTE